MGPNDAGSFCNSDQIEKKAAARFSPLRRVSRSMTSAFIELGSAAKPPAAKPVATVTGVIHQKSPGPSNM